MSEKVPYNPNYGGSANFPPPPPPGAPVYVGQQPVFIQPGVAYFGDQPSSTRCTHCQQQVLTRLAFKSGVLPWLICGGLCLAGVWCGCQFIPFCIDGCKDVEHYCPNCNTLLGVHKRI